MSVGVDVDGLYGLCLAELPTFTAGDVGLALWATGDARARRCRTCWQHAVRTFLATDDDLDRLVGMEVAWLGSDVVVGARTGCRRSAEPRRRRPASPARRPPASTSTTAARRAGVAFPTSRPDLHRCSRSCQLARAGLDDDAREHAEVLANLLVRFQHPDGGWPWLFHAERAVVVEPYEIYSVHQDAMAPMALLELTDLTGDDSLRGGRRARPGLVDREQRARRRSPRPRRALRAPFDPPAARRSTDWSWRANSAAALAHSPLTWQRDSTLELNATCRPYHLGWILEAWSGREHLVETGSSRRRRDLAPRPTGPTADLFGIVIDRLTMDETVARIREMVRDARPAPARRGQCREDRRRSTTTLTLLDSDPLLRHGECRRHVGRLGEPDARRSAARARGRHRPLRTARRAPPPKTARPCTSSARREEVVEEVARGVSAALSRPAHRGLPATATGTTIDAVIDAVRARAPDYLFLAIPSPRKEFWAQRPSRGAGRAVRDGRRRLVRRGGGKGRRARHAGPSRPVSSGHGDSHRSRAGCGAATSTPTPPSCGSRHVSGWRNRGEESS